MATAEQSTVKIFNVINPSDFDGQFFRIFIRVLMPNYTSILGQRFGCRDRFVSGLGLRAMYWYGHSVSHNWLSFCYKHELGKRMEVKVMIHFRSYILTNMNVHIDHAWISLKEGLCSQTFSLALKSYASKYCSTMHQSKSLFCIVDYCAFWNISDQIIVWYFI